MINNFLQVNNHFPGGTVSSAIPTHLNEHPSLPSHPHRTYHAFGLLHGQYGEHAT